MLDKADENRARLKAAVAISNYLTSFFFDTRKFETDVRIPEPKDSNFRELDEKAVKAEGSRLQALKTLALALEGDGVHEDRSAEFQEYRNRNRELIFHIRELRHLQGDEHIDRELKLTNFPAPAVTPGSTISESPSTLSVKSVALTSTCAALRKIKEYIDEFEKHRAEFEKERFSVNDDPDSEWCKANKEVEDALIQIEHLTKTVASAVPEEPASQNQMSLRANLIDLRHVVRMWLTSGRNLRDLQNSEHMIFDDEVRLTRLHLLLQPTIDLEAEKLQLLPTT